jgi:hypothetical protein
MLGESGIIPYPQIFQFLFAVGLLRGIMEFILLIFINRHQDFVLSIFRSGYGFEWLLEMPMSFVAWNIITVYLMWTMISFILKRGGSMLGGEVEGKKIDSAVAHLGILYMSVPFFNLFHLLSGIPFYRYFKSYGFAPYLGVGEVIEQLWAFVLIFLLARRYLQLEWIRSATVALAPFLIGYVLWVLSGLFLVRLYSAVGMPLAIRSTYAILLFYAILMGGLAVYFSRD